MIQDELGYQWMKSELFMNSTQCNSLSKHHSDQFTCMILNAKYNAFFPWNKILMLYNNLYVKYHKIKQPWDSIQ